MSIHDLVWEQWAKIKNLSYKQPPFKEGEVNHHDTAEKTCFSIMENYKKHIHGTSLNKII